MTNQNYDYGQDPTPTESFDSVAPEAQKSSVPLVPILVAVIVALLIAGIALFGKNLGWFGGGDSTQEVVEVTETVDVFGGTSEDGADGEDSGDAVDPFASDDDADEGDKESSGRPAEYPELPAGAEPVNAEAKENKPAGNLNNVWRGSTVTSHQFAQATRDEYAKFFTESGEYEGQIQVYSPVTFRTYTMSCDFNGEFVTCKGGDNAIVYIA